MDCLKQISTIKKSSKILIVGGSGGGKSSFSLKLKELLNIEVYHLDRYFWKPGWIKRETDEWNEIVKELIAKNKWIIEGNYAQSFKERALRADMIFMFDYPTFKYIFRILKDHSGQTLNLK